MVMTTGEFNFDNIFLNNEEADIFYPEVTYTLWIIFIILMPIILNNFLVRQ